MKIKELLHYIHKEQKKTFTSVPHFRTHKTLATKQRGLYWFWTNLPNSQLKKMHKKDKTREVPFSELVQSREGLKNICTEQLNDFTIVYNGIGGYLKTNAFGLRERINQEIKCNDYRTGTLNLERRTNLEHWAVSYFNFDDPKHLETLMRFSLKDKDAMIQEFYKDYAKELEACWRLEFGIPILCRH